MRALTPSAGKFEKHDEYFENDHYVVTSAVGHLVEIKAPGGVRRQARQVELCPPAGDPPHFDLTPIDKTKSRLNAVVKLVKRKDVTELINACDAGREGELIFRLIEQYAEPASRAEAGAALWLQSMTPQAIRDGFDELRSDKQMHGLADAARCRSEADWLVGINGTRAMTAFNSRDGGFFLTTVGRVQTPTLSIVVEREEKIRKHVAARLLGGQGDASLAEAGEYEGKWFDPEWKKNEDDAERRADRVWNERERGPSPRRCAARPATVTEESKPSTQASPLLFDLTSLQREANGRFGFSAKTTLSLAQALYEQHKALTYPRTDSRALPEDYLPVVKETMAMLANERHAGPLRALRARQAGDRRRTTSSRSSACSTTPRCRTTSPSSRRCRRPAPVRRRAEALRPGGQALPRGVLPERRVPGHDAHQPVVAGGTPSRPTARCWSRPAGWRSTARRRRTKTPTWCR